MASGLARAFPAVPHPRAAHATIRGVSSRGVAPARAPPRTPGVRARAAEMMGVPLYADDLLEACAPWGNVCVVAGTHYIPIALPSILGSLFLLAPLVAIAFKLEAKGAEVRRRDARIEELERALDEARRGETKP